MMNDGNTIMFSKGIQLTNNNGQIKKKEYQAMYEGNKGKMVLNDNNDIYYIEADENDIEKLFNKPKSNKDLNEKIKNLVENNNNKKSIKIKTPKRKRKKIHYTIKKSKKKPTKKPKRKPTKKPTKKPKRKPKRKSKRKPKRKSTRKSTQSSFTRDLLKTII